MAQDTTDHGGQHDEDHRERHPGGCAGLLIDAVGRFLVEELRVRKDRVLHQCGGLAQVRGADRITGPIVGARGLDESGVDRQFGVDAAQQLLHRPVGETAGRGDECGRGIGDGLLVPFTDALRFGARDERGGRRGIGDRQGAVQLPGGVRQRFGVVEHRAQGELPVLHARRSGHRGQHAGGGQDDTEHQNLAGSGLEEPPPRMSRHDGCCRADGLGRRVC